MKLNSAKQAHPGLARIWMIESGNWCTKVKIGWIYVNFFAPNENWLADKWNWLPRTKISVPVNEFVCSDSKFEWPNRRASGKCVNLNAHTWIWMRKWWNWPGKPILWLTRRVPPTAYPTLPERLGGGRRAWAPWTSCLVLERLWLWNPLNKFII